jgi:hypothetical protein
VSFPESALNAEYYLFESNGKMIEKGIMKSQVFDCQKYKDGNYFFKIVKQQGVSVFKLNIQR